MTTTPPRLAGWLLRRLLPPDPFETIAGDLEESWHAGTVSRARYWRLTIASIAAFHLARFRPSPPTVTFERTEPRGDTIMRSLFQDLGYGFRLLRRTPAFTTAAVATLALGIGANTAIFSLLNVLMLKPLPYHQPDRVAFVLGWDTERQSNRFSISLADVIDLRQRSRALEDIAVYSYWSANLTGGDRPERVQAYTVSANMFDLLGVRAQVGRALVPEDGDAGAPAVVVISHGLWQRRFGGDASVVGRQAQIDGRPRVIVGVMPEAFEFPVFNFKGDLWAPRPLDEGAILADRASAPRMTAVARLRDGIPYSRAQADVDTQMLQLERDHPETNRAASARLVEMGKLDDDAAGPAMLIIAATVGVVLLLACANVANLLLARGVSRHRELAVRAALGAGRARIIRQLLVESLLLAIAGGLAGTALAFFALDLLRAGMPDAVLTTVPNINTLGLDGTTLAFTAAVSVATSLVFGLVPAWRASRPAVQEGLKESAVAAGGTGTRRLRGALVVAEIALSTTLLVSAGLLVRSYQNLQRVAPGFAADGVLTMAITLPEQKYADDIAITQFFERAEQEISRLPGVERAAFVNVLPFSTYNRGSRFVIDGRPPVRPGGEPAADFRSVTTEYFRTMGIPILSGRAFDRGDRAGAAPVAMVNRTFAQRYLDGEDPVGRRVRVATAAADAPWLTIVGTVGDVHHTQLVDAPAPELYMSFAQAPRSMMMLAARASGDPELLAAPVRGVVEAIDPAQPVFHVKTLSTLVDESMAAQSIAASMVAVFSALALLLASVGTYGVISYAVSQQTRELGVRMALGATRSNLMQLVLKRGLVLVFGGLILGLAGALAATRLIAGVLYGVGASDPLTYAGVTAVLLTVGAAACGIPAWRATRVEPVTALRMD